MKKTPIDGAAAEHQAAPLDVQILTVESVLTGCHAHAAGGAGSTTSVILDQNATL